LPPSSPDPHDHPEIRKEPKQIAPYKYPRRVEFLDALPRTETGKIQRFKLRELEIGRVEAEKLER
jgi:2-aminobenzoate-CoA ligase